MIAMVGQIVNKSVSPLDRSIFFEKCIPPFEIYPNSRKRTQESSSIIWQKNNSRKNSFLINFNQAHGDERNSNRKHQNKTNEALLLRHIKIEIMRYSFPSIYSFPLQSKLEEKSKSTGSKSRNWPSKPLCRSGEIRRIGRRSSSEEGRRVISSHYDDDFRLWIVRRYWWRIDLRLLVFFVGRRRVFPARANEENQCGEDEKQS